MLLYWNPLHDGWKLDHMVRAVATQFACATQIAAEHAQGFEFEAQTFATSNFQRDKVLFGMQMYVTGKVWQCSSSWTKREPVLICSDK